MSNGSNVDSEGRYWRVPTWFPALGAETLNKLRAFNAELLYFNGRMNLISPKTEKVSDNTHIADGIMGSQAILNCVKPDTIYDIGSGNGIPGVIFALLSPTTKVVCVDSDARKVEFIRHCASRLLLTNCVAAQQRFEDLPESSVRFVMSRGFAAISKSLVAARKCAAPGCQYFHFKGPSWSTEIASLPSQVLAHWEPSHITDYKLPGDGAEMTIVLTRKK